jgi:diguanylate cyclase (GGDEF)-like protein/putative nucleotidyltransferase with HDIG domain
MGATTSIAPAPDLGAVAEAERRETSGVTSRLMLCLVERECGPEGVDLMLRRAGLEHERDQLLDENHWFSWEKKIALLEAAAEVLGESPAEAGRRIGAAALDFNLAQGVKLSLRALGSPRLIYKNIVRASSKFTQTHRMEAVEVGTHHARIRYFDVSGRGYHPGDCGLNVGYLSSAPVLFGLPPARISHPVCARDGGDSCVYDIRWEDGASRLRKALGAGAAAVATLGGAVAFAPALTAEAGGLAAAILALAGAREWRFRERRYRLLEQKAAHNADGAQRLEQSLRDLVSDLRVDEVLEKITRNAQAAVGGKEFALLVHDEGAMTCRSSSGLPARATRALEEWATARTDGLSAATLLDDLTQVPELAALPADREQPLRSLCAAPLISRADRAGVLVALSNGVSGFLPNDVALLESYATQAAIALGNARMYETQAALATRDPLTELFNHREFHESVARELERCRRHGGGLAVILFDLDGFKAVNDTRGHAAGDRVLRAVAAALSGSARTSDLAYRIGGDEFALLLPDTSGREAIAAAERAAEAMGAAEARIGVSYGIAEWPHAGPSKDTLLACADMNLYAMKNASSNPSTRGATVDPASDAASAARAASADAARQRQRLTAARRLSALLGPLLDPGDIARATVDELADSFGWFLVVMHRLHGDGMLRPVAGAGQMVAGGAGAGVLAGWEQSQDAGINGRAVRTGEPVIVPDTSREPDFIPAGAADLFAGSELAVPIRVAGEVWGVLNLEDREADAFGPDDLVFADMLAGHIGAALDRSRLYAELEETFTTTLAMLSDALERKDAYTAAHADDVADLSIAVARRLGLGEAEVKNVNYGGLLHDIGKIGIRSEILLKPSKLTPAEFAEMAQHTIIGADMLARIPFFADVVPLVRSAHERWDGHGYPDGLKGDEIPLGARIICACDAYNAMITARPYKGAMPRGQAVAELARNRGTQFDPDVVDALLAELGEQVLRAPARG